MIPVYKEPEYPIPPAHYFEANEELFPSFFRDSDITPFPIPEESGCPRGTYPYQSKILFWYFACKIPWSIDPLRVEETSSYDPSNAPDLLRNTLKGIFERVNKYPEHLNGTGAVQILQVGDTWKDILSEGWGQIIILDGKYYVATAEHVLGDKSKYILISNNNGYLIFEKTEEIKYPIQPTNNSGDKAISLLEIPQNRLGFLVEEGQVLSMEEYDDASPTFVFNTMYCHFGYEGTLFEVVSQRFEDGSIIYWLKDHSGSSLCQGISGTAIVQLQEVEGMGAPKLVVIGFASWTPPLYLDSSLPNKKLDGARCSKFNVAIGYKNNFRVENRKIKEQLKNWEFDIKTHKSSQSAFFVRRGRR